ncbi:FMN phosphatase YigB, HAD superfamily [Glycomyces harbinensis]|uniref:FMN phosphatase YigB, HAD superfamily n=1 Tax=Glycomyces harbinensis TaxID=58114 RepID=A0A1G6U6W9_9ACTN|nr:FMN phosphatase YigB, HAD superfamily [Glycomyces harbinensis]
MGEAAFRVASHYVKDAILLFDYDGTVRLGSEHATHYARLVAGRLDPEDERAFLSAHAAFVAGKPTTASTFDAYDADNAVRRLAGEFGVPESDRHDAYIETRELMAAGKFQIWAPKGFREFIWSLPRSVEVALVTNAPGASLGPALERLELDGLFDHVIGDAGKPEGLDAIIDELLEERPPAQLLSIGDIPRNDLAPAVERGCATAYIDHYGRPWPDATVTGASLEELYPFIHRWVTEQTA